MTRVLIAGLGNMGRSHALAHHNHPDAGTVGLVNRSAVALPKELDGYPMWRDFDAAPATMLRAIATNTDLSRHMNEAVHSLRICLAADDSIRHGRPVDLQET